APGGTGFGVQSRRYHSRNPEPTDGGTHPLGVEDYPLGVGPSGTRPHGLGNLQGGRPRRETGYEGFSASHARDGDIRTTRKILPEGQLAMGMDSVGSSSRRLALGASVA